MFDGLGVHIGSVSRSAFRIAISGVKSFFTTSGRISSLKKRCMLSPEMIESGLSEQANSRTLQIGFPPRYCFSGKPGRKSV